ncbi:MAG: ATP-binding protein [Candidatus Aenigmarchaeota archaeon]
MVIGYFSITQSPELTNIMVIITIVVVIFTILIGIFISRSITKPIIRLRDAAKEIGEGKLGTKIEVKSGDEVGDLASAFRQMTEHLEASKKQLEGHTEELEGKVQERTGELDKKVMELTKTKIAVLNMMEDMDRTNQELVETQEELKESLKELKETDTKKDQFISIVAHELKSPLTSIHGFSQLLQSSKIANNFTKRNKYLKIMRHETKRLSELVTDILDLSSIDLGTLKISLEKFDINKLLNDVKREMDIQVEEKGLESEYNVKNIQKIVTDKEKLTQILINLISNAVNYTPKGKVTVKVFGENGNAHFVVKDTGIGITKDEQEKIFERFYQVDSSYTRKACGAGLGLALCKEFVEILGGKMWIKSEKGKGSEFHFTLPIKGVQGKRESLFVKSDVRKPDSLSI